MMTFRCLSKLPLLALVLCAALAQATPPPTAGTTVKTTQEMAHEAAVVAKQAKAYYAKKQFALAAELYRRAFELNPARPEFLYGVGRSEQMAGHVPQAREALEKLRQLLPPTHKLQNKAAEAFVEMQEVIAEPVVVIPPPTPPTPVTAEATLVVVQPPHAPTPVVVQAEQPKPNVVAGAPSPTGDSSRLMSQGAMWTGGTFLVAGIAFALWAEVDRSTLASDLGVIRGTEAASRQSTINGLSTASVIAAAAGAGVLALGLYWRIGEQSPSQRTPTLTATPTSVELSWRF